jgi:hypothetical protein
VKRGEGAFERSEYVTHEQVGRRLQRFLQPRWRSVGRSGAA